MSAVGPILPEPSGPVPLTMFEAPPDRERRNRFYRWLMHLGLPLGLSLCFHVVLLTAAAVYTFTVRARPDAEVGPYEAGLVENPDDRAADAFQWSQQLKLDTPEVEPLQDLTFRDFSRVSPLDESALKETAGESGAGDVGELGLGEGRFSLLGTGAGAGEAGTGGFGGGLGGRGGGLGQAGMWDLRVQANKIVYVVDYSGSIIVAVDDLKRELKRSVGALRPSQSFDVILFYSEGTGGQSRFKSESFAPSLQAVTREVRTQFFEWLDRRSPRGETEPLQSMKRALSLRPEAIFLFSDGYFDDSVVPEVTRANRGVEAKIICFVFDELLLGDTSGVPKETDGARRMRKIAEQNRGQVKIVTGKDLGRK
jgi:hypothetical protein